MNALLECFTNPQNIDKIMFGEMQRGFGKANVLCIVMLAAYKDPSSKNR